MAQYFLNKAQREWLIAEYMEQIEEFDQLDEFPEMEDTLRSCNNVELVTLCVDFMPAIMDFLPKK